MVDERLKKGIFSKAIDYTNKEKITLYRGLAFEDKDEFISFFKEANWIDEFDDEAVRTIFDKGYMSTTIDKEVISSFKGKKYGMDIEIESEVGSVVKNR